MPEINKRRPESQDAFVTLTCPICGTNTKASKDDPPSLPDECAVCIERQTKSQVDELDEPPTGASHRELAALQSNVTRLQGEQRKMAAEITAMHGDMADMRRMVLAVMAPSGALSTDPPNKRKAKG